jgi:hypothetical protein
MMYAFTIITPQRIVGIPLINQRQTPKRQNFWKKLRRIHDSSCAVERGASVKTIFPL